MATPIGNLADLSLRALHLLGVVDAVACEDTRLSGALLQRLGLHRPLLAVHEHNEEAAAAGIVARLQRGERIAYVSDAGTPAVSDPGARLVAAVQAAGLRVLPLPGASSVVTALSVAGDVRAQGFRFEGFLPTQSAARRSRLAALEGERASVVLFEAPHRIADLADDLAASLPGRRVTVCRELTKQFEQIHSLLAVELPGWLALQTDHRRGEFVLVLHAPLCEAGDAAAEPAAVPVDRLLRTLLEELPLRQAVALCAQASGQPRNALYQQALAWQAGRGDPGVDVDGAQGTEEEGGAAREGAGLAASTQPSRPTAVPADWPADPRRVAAARRPASAARRRR